MPKFGRQENTFPATLKVIEPTLFTSKIAKLSRSFSDYDLFQAHPQWPRSFR
jgi:hypothetical protein